MRIDVAGFSDRGESLAKTLARKLRETGDAVRVERCGGDTPLRGWVAERFHDTDALVFIGAAGIAVRAIAPEIVSKTSDPAVVALDERGRFAISLLSGHIGGANALTERIAALLGAVPVITTATDINNIFAVDTWATRNGLAIINPERIKFVSARLLSGEQIGIDSAFPIEGALPEGLVRTGDGFDVLVGISRVSPPGALLLVPRVAALGVGCRKGTPEKAIEDAFGKFCEAGDIRPEAFLKVCSIDLKRDEPGLIAFCERRGLPFETFSAESLMEAKGDFAASKFVESVTGADNVCERSAVLGSGGRLLVGKSAYNGVTMAAAVREYSVSFKEDGEGA